VASVPQGWRCATFIIDLLQALRMRHSRAAANFRNRTQFATHHFKIWASHLSDAG
jgi:hypothetical protein